MRTATRSTEPADHLPMVSPQPVPRSTPFACAVSRTVHAFSNRHRLQSPTFANFHAESSTV
jgi:hypothetical protein